MKVHTTSFGIGRSEKVESQDAFDVQSWGETVIAVVADGVGGARDGKEAAKRVVESLINNYRVRPQTWIPAKALSEFARLINGTLYQESLSRYERPEMVSTVAVAVIEGDTLYGLNAGDSRIYVGRRQEMKQLSLDHAENSLGMTHVLTQAIGLCDELRPYCFEQVLEDGDFVLLCSDGVSNVLTEEDLRALLNHRATARTILYSARERATPETVDDMSAVVIDITEVGRLKSESALPLVIPETLKKGDAIDGFTLVKPFQHSDRVWLATRGANRYTIKFAPLEARTNEAVLNLFIKETWNATRIEGDYFVKAFVPAHATARCYVMDFVDAPSLRTLLRSRRLAVDEAVTLAKFLLNACQYLLRYDLVHGDIKPENILVLTDFDRISFKLIDLGSTTEIFSTITRAGTASYLAPERFHEAPISERTELYAIGATLFQALTGTLPYGEIERFQTPNFGVPKIPSRLNPNIPHWLESMLLRSIESDPAKRYQNYSELLFELDYPEKVAPYHPKVTSLEKTLFYYKVAFYLVSAIAIFLLARLLMLQH